MGGELGNGTSVDVLLKSSALFPPNFTLIGNDDFYSSFVWESWCFLSFRGYLGGIESEKTTSKAIELFTPFFFSARAIICRGQRFHFSSTNS